MGIGESRGVNCHIGLYEEVIFLQFVDFSRDSNRRARCNPGQRQTTRGDFFSVALD